MTAESTPAPKAAPLFGVIALLCAIGALFFPHFLLALPVLAALIFGAVSLFRKERWPVLAILAMIGAAGLLLLPGFAVAPSNNVAALNDITMGQTTGGSLRPGHSQFVCFDEADAIRGEHLPGAESVEGAQSAVETQLMQAGRCTYTDGSVGFEMTADGKERFTTPHGVVELWAPAE